MVNVQLEDTLDGGSMVFYRNDYPLDEGIYSELYTCLFGTASAEWLLDGAFNVNSYNISARTGITLRKNGSTSQENINLIKKAVDDDLKRFTEKNKNIEIKDVVIAYYSKTILIVIELTGYNDAFNFIYQKTKESLETAEFKTY